LEESIIARREKVVAEQKRLEEEANMTDAERRKKVREEVRAAH